MTDTSDTAHPSDRKVGQPARPAGDDEALDPLDEQEDESFPASDPHSDWAGPPEEIERP